MPCLRASKRSPAPPLHPPRVSAESELVKGANNRCRPSPEVEVATIASSKLTLVHLLRQQTKTLCFQVGRSRCRACGPSERHVLPRHPTLPRHNRARSVFASAGGTMFTADARLNTLARIHAVSRDLCPRLSEYPGRSGTRSGRRC